MKRLLSLFFMIFIISCSTQEKDVTIIAGKLVGYDGNPLIEANIKFSFIGKVKPVSLNPEDDGSYKIKTDHIGYMNVEFSGLNHHEAKVPILFSKPEIITLNIQLSSNEDNNDANIQFMDTSSISSKYHSINEWFKEYRNKYDLEKVGEEIFEKINIEQDIDVKVLLCFLYMKNFFNSPKVDINKAKKILQIMPPSSIAWTMGPNFLAWFWFILPQNDHDLLDSYIKRVSNENKYQPVKAEAINYLLSMAEMEKDSIKIRSYYNRLITECPESFQTKIAKFKYDILAPGKDVPTFSVTSIDKPEESYSEKSLLGKVYLIEFWATSCGHCETELPYMHDAYEKYKERGFEILSLSLDKSPSDVTNFRKGEWKMPWLHALLKDGFENEIAEKFGVIGTPTPILVDGEGKIIATKNTVRQENLVKTLDEYFEVTPK